MGGGGGKAPSAPVTPPPAPPVTPAPEPPKMEDIGKSEQELKAKKMREMQRLKKGRSATVLTSGQGDTGQLATATQNLKAQKTKLGQ
ncbi:hypothetical protein [Maridesulfovibrio sp.]|uniref:hypothetical protein n=1 Tax=Maridesulfovibrio sp. TaxID=2795000 RepID=UPI0029CA5CAF|nr:hypothetical protein [Maridesulfovibrio sp.]